MTDQVTPDEVHETPFQKATELLQLMLSQSGGISVGNTADQLALIQTLLAMDLHNQLQEQRRVLEAIAKKLDATVS